MEGKFELQFEDNEYYLVDGNTNDTVATTDKVLLKEYDGYMKKLSLKNCDAISNGYDLDELGLDYYKLVFGNTKSYKDGFQKALELMGDKKFSEEDMKKAIHFGASWREQLFNGTTKTSELFESLQPKEWDVIIEMECPECKEWGYISECRNNCNQKFLQPKFDANGCLILKRK